MISKEKMTELVLRWQTYWNSDPMRMIEECYTEDCKIFDMGGYDGKGGGTYHGRKTFKEIETMIVETVPSRRLDAYYLAIQENVAIIEGDITFKKENETATVKTCIVLRFNDEGLITEDHSYSNFGDHLK